MVTGIICEYNPFHNGHKKQIQQIKAKDPDGAIVCLMSGNFVQRGAPAIVDKSLRAKAAVLCGADLVLELPVTYALRSAEGFAAGGVEILSGFCRQLSFGAETDDAQGLMDTAKLLLSQDFSQNLRSELEKGISFPAARQNALEAMGGNGTLIIKPNNILGVEYCKAILAQGSQMTIAPVLRQGDYHAIEPDLYNPSATFVRKQMSADAPWKPYVPEEATKCFEGATLHSLASAEQAILYRLRTMSDDEFEALPFGAEGLWRKLMHASRSCNSLDDILEQTKSKRYTRSRLDRMVMCAFLGIHQALLDSPAPYARVLAFNQTGRSILKQARETRNLPNIGQPMDDPYALLEQRCNDLYGLCTNMPELAGLEKERRIFSL